MREIKFRAWHKQQKKFISVFLTNYGNVYDFFSEKSLQDEIEISQYTGFKDKNEVEIYEGDILSGEFYFGGTGWFDTGEGYYKLENEVVEFEDGSFRVGGSYLSNVSEDIEIVGNIYENPELLESKKKSNNFGRGLYYAKDKE